MKRIIEIAVIFFLCSCTTIEQFTKTEIIDYSHFEKNGIYITESNNVDFAYKPLGSIVSVTRGALENLSSYLDKDKAFAEIGKKVKNMGGNGIINMNISTSYINSYYYMTVTGMVIKIEGEETGKTTTYQEKIGAIDNIGLEVLEAYSNGTRVQTPEKLNVEQIKQAYKKYFYRQKQVQFYTAEGWVNKKAYAAIIDGQIVNYEDNSFTPIN